MRIQTFGLVVTLCAFPLTTQAPDARQQLAAYLNRIAVRASARKRIESLSPRELREHPRLRRVDRLEARLEAQCHLVFWLDFCRSHSWRILIWAA